MQRRSFTSIHFQRWRLGETSIFLVAAVVYTALLLWPLLTLEGEVGSPVVEAEPTQVEAESAQAETALPPAAATERQASVQFLTPPRWLLPVDDPYIFIRFAQQISRGRFHQWTDGEVSSGASSLVYPWLLLPAQWMFPDLAGWSRWSSAVGTLSLWLLAMAAARLLRGAGLPSPWPLMGGLALIFCGPIAWVSVGGMDSAMACAALLWTCGAWSAARNHAATTGAAPPRSATGLMVLLSLLPWVRPDFALITGLAALAVTFGRGPAVPRWQGPLLLTPGFLWAVFNVTTTGHASPAGVMAKSALSSPFVSLGYGVEIVVSLVQQKLLPLYAGLRPSILPPPVGWLAIATVLAIGLVVCGRRPFGLTVSDPTKTTLRYLAPLAVAWCCSILSTSLSGYMSWQQYRHHHPGLACAWLLAASGLFLALRGMAQRPWARPLWHGEATRRFQGLVYVLLLCLPLLLLSRASEWSYRYFRSAVQFYQDNGTVAEWLEEHGRDEVLLVHDAGLLVLAHDGPAVDMMGLGTPHFALPYRDGSGAVVEHLARHRPLPRLAAGLDRLLRIRGLLGPPLFEAPSRRYLDDGMYVAPIRTELLTNTALAEPGIDFADASSEGQVDLHWDPAPRSLSASFALAYVEADTEGQITMHGCRPLRHTLTIQLPPPGNIPAQRSIHLRWAPQPGMDGRIQIRSGSEAAGRVLSAVPHAAHTGRWASATAPIDSNVTHLRIENLGQGEPCLESLALFPALGNPP